MLLCNEADRGSNFASDRKEKQTSLWSYTKEPTNKENQTET
jgi:hypothetical protein